ncbi:MAG: hypothetical protein K2X93_23195 [Candidatus Obscuribacterales bacterium]|nr:hypothetical protein [Candidatus Obscuribacterales bacterium]
MPYKKPRPEPIAFVKHITTRTGKVLYAEDYGLKGFPIRRRRTPRK